MLSVSNTLKMGALAALLSVGAVAASTAPASADTISTRCYGDDCHQVRCNDEGYACVRVPDYPEFYSDETDYTTSFDHPDHARMICDSFGDNCHYAVAPEYNSPGYYDSYGVWHDAW
jgi:hypothetical protein